MLPPSGLLDRQPGVRAMSHAPVDVLIRLRERSAQRTWHPIGWLDEVVLGQRVVAKGLALEKRLAMLGRGYSRFANFSVMASPHEIDERAHMQEKRFQHRVVLCTLEALCFSQYLEPQDQPAKLTNLPEQMGPKLG